MPRCNHVTLVGRILSDPKFETLQTNNTPCIRFSLAVPRDATQMSQKQVESGLRPEESGKRQRIDIIRICEYGARAKADYFYLKKNTVVVVTGWVEQRSYIDKRDHRRKSAIDINAENIVPSYGADFDRGNRQREMRAEDTPSQAMSTSEMELAGLTFAALPPDADLDIGED